MGPIEVHNQTFLGLKCLATHVTLLFIHQLLLSTMLLVQMFSQMSLELGGEITEWTRVLGLVQMENFHVTSPKLSILEDFATTNIALVHSHAR